MRRAVRPALLALLLLLVLAAALDGDEQGQAAPGVPTATSTATAAAATAASPTVAPPTVAAPTVAAPTVAAPTVAAPTPPPQASGAPAPGDRAEDLLRTLSVRQAPELRPYARSSFGPSWYDTDGNGCDTRNDVLRRDLVDVRTTPGSHGCTVVAGSLADPYSGRRVAFAPGDGVQVDHVVSLADAWDNGAAAWTEDQRRDFANDPVNLLAVLGAQNQAKGGRDAGEWLPGTAEGRCVLVRRQVLVKATYALTVSDGEGTALRRVLRACAAGGPVATATPSRTPSSVPTPEPAPPAPRAQPPRKSSAGSRYGTCAQAKAAGGGPYRAGVDPEYGWYRDADSDGVVCE